MNQIVDLRDEALYALCQIVLNIPPSTNHKLFEHYETLHNFMRAMEVKHENP